jgi:hypothetical protein
LTSYTEWDVNNEGGIVAAKPCIDLKIVGYFHMAMGLWACLAAALVWFAALNTAASVSPPSVITAFGLLTIEGTLPVSVYTLAIGVSTFIAGLWVLQRHRFGWYLLLLFQANGFAIVWLYYANERSTSYFYSAVAWSVLTLTFSVILIVRRKQFFVSEKHVLHDDIESGTV